MKVAEAQETVNQTDEWLRLRRLEFNIGKLVGERAGGRTLDLLIKSQLLYRLSYTLPKQLPQAMAAS